MKIRMKMNRSVVLDEEEMKEIDWYYVIMVGDELHRFPKLCWEPVPEDYDERESQP